MTDLAQRQVRSGREGAEAFRVTAGRGKARENISSEVAGVTVEYDAGSLGASTATLHPYSSLEPASLGGAEIAVDVGYGSTLQNYFVGTLEEIDDSGGAYSGLPNEGIAWGPFKLMEEQRLLEQVDYAGLYLDAALADLVNRTRYPAGKTEIVSGKSYLIAGESVFVLETRLLEAAEALCESANFVMSDRPYGRRLFMPRPRPGAFGATKAVYTDAHIPAGGFSAPALGRRGFYARVVVFRREANGALAFPLVDVAVENESRNKPPPNKAYVIPEFAGDEQAAREEAARTAEALRTGTYAPTLKGAAANPDLLPFDAVGFEGVTEFRWRTGVKKDAYEVSYRATMDGGISLSASRAGNSMDFAATGIRVREKLLPKVFPVGPRRRSRAVVRQAPGGGATPPPPQTLTHRYPGPNRYPSPNRYPL